MLNNLVALLDSGVAASTTSYESIATVTVGAGGSSSITFSSIPSTYKHLQLRFSTQATASSSLYIKMNFNSDTAANYSYHQLFGDGTSASANAGASASFGIASNGVNSATGFTGGVIDLLEYSNTNIYKTQRALTGTDLNGSGTIYLVSSNWRSTSAINRIDLVLSANNFAQYSQFALYGVKG